MEGLSWKDNESLTPKLYFSFYGKLVFSQNVAEYFMYKKRWKWRTKLKLKSLRGNAFTDSDNFKAL